MKKYIDITVKNIDSSAELLKTKYVSWDNIVLIDRTLAWKIELNNGNCHEKTMVNNLIEEYNRYADFVYGLPNFIDEINKNNMSISRENAEKMWGEEDTNRVFSKHNYPFETQLVIYNNCLMLGISENYEVKFDDNVVAFSIGINDGMCIQTKLDKQHIVLNAIDSSREYTQWATNTILFATGVLDNNNDFYASLEPDDYNYNILKCFDILVDMGYIKVFHLHTDRETSIWKLFSNDSDKAIEIAVADLNFAKNKLAVEKLKLVLSAEEYELKSKPYILTDKYGKQYLSSQKGKIAGNKRQRIYGKLDCKSANRYIKKGGYVQHRVFFANENDAISAGYRPCGICMSNEYEIWKNARDDNDCSYLLG